MSDVFSEYLRLVERTLLGEDETVPRAPSRLVPRSTLVCCRGVREPKGRVKGYRVEVRPSRWPRKIWAGTFPDRKQAMRAYDATLHYTGKTPYYFLYPDGYFLPFPPGLENAPPQSKEFVQFVKRMAKEFSLNSRELARNPISELLDMRVVNLAESDQLTSDKGVEEEAEVVSNPLPALFPVPEVALQYDYPDQTVAATVTGATCFQMDSPTGEDLAKLLFNADGVVGLDKNLLFGDSDLWRDQLSDLVPALFCPDNDDVVEPASKKRILRVASFKVDTARDASGMMPGADNTKKSCLHPCLEPVFRGS
ncbi:unnamed protein product [Sphagnum jensenii]|uniref:AP2/ERF domain-containing protein n=1 Tax=Sphagnum jensenii TaxID=128206 RepID=A0ABP0V8V6_9BRYO